MSISSAGVGHDLHVAVVHEGKILHRIRTLDGRWSKWGAIVPPVGHEFAEVSCAGVGNALHLFIRDASGILWHDIRRADGSWQGMAQLRDQPLLGG